MFKGLKEVDMLKSTLENAQTKQGEAARVLIDQNKEIIDTLNEHTKALVSIYQALEAIAKEDENIELPEPLTDMKVE
jgi:hypothetical protein